MLWISPDPLREERITQRCQILAVRMYLVSEYMSRRLSDVPNQSDGDNVEIITQTHIANSVQRTGHSSKGKWTPNASLNAHVEIAMKVLLESMLTSL